MRSLDAPHLFLAGEPKLGIWEFCFLTVNWERSTEARTEDDCAYPYWTCTIRIGIT